jgi:hypothetical protein
MVGWEITAHKLTLVSLRNVSMGPHAIHITALSIVIVLKGIKERIVRRI